MDLTLSPGGDLIECLNNTSNRISLLSFSMTDIYKKLYNIGMHKVVDVTKSPKVGIQVLIIKDGKFLIGKDTKKGDGVYGVPGGKWENGETLVEGGIREVEEESGILCQNLKLINVYDFFREDKGVSYVSIGFVAEYAAGDLQSNVEEGRLDWQWVGKNEVLELNLYPAGRVLIEAYLAINN